MAGLFPGTVEIGLDAVAEGENHGAIDDDCAEFKGENPEVVKPQADSIVLSVYPTLLDRKSVS